MSRLLPPNRPLLPVAQIEKVILQHRAQLRPSDEVILVVWRGYYRDTLGEPGRNDVGI